MKGWRTISFNCIVVAAFAIISMPELHAVLPGSIANWFVLFVALVNMWLRYVTTTAIGAKE